MKIKKQSPKIKNLKPLIKGNKHYYFGYYGKSPWNSDERYAVALEVNFIDKHSTEKDSANIILLDCESGNQKIIAKTNTWNWQQGCMLQWLPNEKNKIIFNDRKNGKFISRIIDVKTKKERMIPYPIYDIHPSGKYALNISYEKLNSVREGYGYPGGEIDQFKDKISKGEGIYLVDLKTKKRKLIVDLKDLYKYKNLSTMDKGKHWIDQPVFNPKGDRLCFLHRWDIQEGLFHTRFFTIDVNGNNLFMFPDSGFYSHFIWRNNKEILMFCSVSEKFGNIRKGGGLANFIIRQIRPIYRKAVPRFFRKRVLPIGYFLLRDKSKDHQKINIYNDDGHPSFSPNGRYVVTDTYPNSSGYRKLMIYDWKKRKTIVLGNFYSLPNKNYLQTTKNSKDYLNWGNSPFRVDLHPRWDRKGKKICFDSIHEGRRGVYRIDLNFSEFFNK